MEISALGVLICKGHMEAVQASLTLSSQVIQRTMAIERQTLTSIKTDSDVEEVK